MVSGSFSVVNNGIVIRSWITAGAAKCVDAFADAAPGRAAPASAAPPPAISDLRLRLVDVAGAGESIDVVMVIVLLARRPETPPAILAGSPRWRLKTTRHVEL